MRNTSRILLNRESLKANLSFLRRMMGQDRLISLVVKGNAYGHGIHAYVPLAESLGMHHFSVFSAWEAWQVKEAANQPCEIMIMGMLFPDELDWAVRHKVSFFVFDLDRLRLAIETAKNLGIPARIHLEVETGMNRTGLERGCWEETCRLLHQNKQWLVFEGLCTHFAGAESIANYARIMRQKKQFGMARAYFASHGHRPKRYHCACSAAAIRYPATRMDMVRIGILQYGFWPSRETFIEYVKNRKRKNDPLKRVIRWESEVMSTKRVAEGDFIGYGTSFLASRPMHIAVVPVGYSHGFSRALSNSGHALIRGRRVPVIGTINMNALSLDITDVPEVVPGDEVVLIGHQDDQEVSVASFSEMSSQLNYELLTRLPMDIPRQVYPITPSDAPKSS